MLYFQLCSLSFLWRLDFCHLYLVSPWLFSPVSCYLGRRSSSSCVFFGLLFHTVSGCPWFLFSFFVGVFSGLLLRFKELLLLLVTISWRTKSSTFIRVRSHRVRQLADVSPNFTPNPSVFGNMLTEQRNMQQNLCQAWCNSFCNLGIKTHKGHRCKSENNRWRENAKGKKSKPKMKYEGSAEIIEIELLDNNIQGFCKEKQLSWSQSLLYSHLRRSMLSERSKWVYFWHYWVFVPIFFSQCHDCLLVDWEIRHIFRFYYGNINWRFAFFPHYYYHGINNKAWQIY